jgi:hypothetical protein
MKKEPILFEDPDPLDGLKAIGCLLIGVVLLIALLGVSYSIISNLRLP